MKVTSEQQLATMPVGSIRTGIRAGDKVPFLRTNAASNGDVVLCSFLGDWRIMTVRRRLRNGYAVSEPGSTVENLLTEADGFMIHGVILYAAADTEARPFYWKMRDDGMEPLIRRGELVRVDPRRRHPSLIDQETVVVRVDSGNVETIGIYRSNDRGAWLERLNAPPLILGRTGFTIVGALMTPRG